jgi:hypothetical protein
MPLNFGGGENTDLRSLQLLVPAKNKYEELKMMSRIPSNVRIPAALINVIQRKTGSKVLKMYCEEFYQHTIAFEGQARADVCEIAQTAKLGDGDRLP